jgi:hypothetical protein
MPGKPDAYLENEKVHDTCSVVLLIGQMHDTIHHHLQIQSLDKCGVSLFSVILIFFLLSIDFKL